MKQHAVVILAPGFEEIEAVTLIDVLRRADIKVTVAGLEGAGPVKGSHNIVVEAEAGLATVASGTVDLLALPGGLPGSTHLAGSAAVLRLVREVKARGGRVAAICAAPLALREAGVLDGRRMTVFPSMKDQFPNSTYVAEPVVVDGPIITGSGPGTALRFAVALVEALGHGETAAQLRQGMLVL